MAGERGSGAGKGGGGGGTIREAGGSFGKMEAAHEDQYFYNLVSCFNFLALIEKRVIILMVFITFLKDLTILCSYTL